MEITSRWFASRGLRVIIAGSLLLGAAACDLSSVEDPEAGADEPVVAETRFDPTNSDTPLDLRFVRTHVSPKSVEVTLAMHEEWGDVRVRVGMGGMIAYLNTTGDEEFDAYLAVTYEEQSNKKDAIQCGLHRPNGHLIELVKLSRANERTVTCEVDRSALPGDGGLLSWSAATDYPGRYGGRIWDYAPDVGYYEP